MIDGLTTCPATIEDAPALVALVNSAYRGDGSRVGWTTEADLLGGQRIDVAGMTAIISSPDSVVLLLVQNRIPIACVQLQRTGVDCYLGMVTVRPALQRTGLGSRLMQEAEEWAIAHWSSQSMHMTVITQRIELISWYERRGYQRTGERKPFPYGDERFGLPKRPDLRFEVLEKAL